MILLGSAETGVKYQGQCELQQWAKNMKLVHSWLLEWVMPEREWVHVTGGIWISQNQELTVLNYLLYPEPWTFFIVGFLLNFQELAFQVVLLCLKVLASICYQLQVSLFSGSFCGLILGIFIVPKLTPLLQFPYWLTVSKTRLFL